MAVFVSKTNPYTAPTTYQVRVDDFSALIVPYTLSGQIVDVVQKRIYSGIIYVNGMGDIEKIEERSVPSTQYILPGLVDSHVHVESTMTVPSEFARVAVKHGVVAALCDPHEIANVLGIEGVQYMIDNGKRTPFKFYFGAPSCVPATPFESAGAVLDAAAVSALLDNPDIYYLAEMMNYPGVIHSDPEVMAKIDAARKRNMPIDGHAPGLRGDDLKKYAAAGISTDHECMSVAEAEEKIALGMKILIREGSAAKNFEALYPLIDMYPDSVMLCTDDAHPDDFTRTYINGLVKRALQKGQDIFNVLRAATLNPVQHYKLPVGMLQIGHQADLITVDNLDEFNIQQTYIKGRIVYDRGEVSFPRHENATPNAFHASHISAQDVSLPATGKKLRVIEIIDKELYTKTSIEPAKVLDNNVVSDVENDILKIIVLNRYQKDAKPAIGFVKNFGLKQGALCSTVAHDSHNIIAVGTSDQAIAQAVNSVIDTKGGIVAYDGNRIENMPLPVAGIMSVLSVDQAAARYEQLHNMALQMGSTLTAPFMTLAFMALIVIPELKIYDNGLFDVTTFNPVDVFAD